MKCENQSCSNCMYCYENKPEHEGESEFYCMQSPISEKGPVKIKEDFLNKYRCKEYNPIYPSSRYLKE